MIDEKPFGCLGVIGRFKPLHLGGARMLEGICEHAQKVIIGIGSSNKYNMRNPFTAQESEEMVRRHLSQQYDNFEIVHVPDFAHIPKYNDGRKWKEYVQEHFGELDAFVTGNEYVTGLFSDTYRIIHPAALIPKEKWIRLRATEVRVKMAQGDEGWKDLVPDVVAEYIVQESLDERFRKEFGSATLEVMGELDYHAQETRTEEYLHTLET